jgi:hypothetical protein
VETAPIKGTKSSKCKKDVKGAMKRKFMKNLINKEFEIQKTEVFNELLKSKDLGGAIKFDDDDLYDDQQE